MESDSMKFRRLKAEEIECRVNTINEKGLTLLLYKDARCDMNILDEEIGEDNWQRKHYECKGNLFCSVGIRNGDTWTFKDDCGAESYTEKEKGEASDSFKRACVNWGIGRELYTSPFIWIPASEVKMVDKNGKKSTYDKFYVSKIGCSENGKITVLEIRKADKSNKCVFGFNTEEKTKLEYINDIQKTALLNAIKVVNGDIKKTLDYLQRHYPASAPQTINEITLEQFTPLILQLEKQKEQIEKQETEQ